MKNIFASLLGFLLLSGSFSSFAEFLPGEEISRDPVTGNYTAKYRWDDDPNQPLYTATLDTATNIEPRVDSSVQITGGWVIHYRYRLKNGKKSKQPIDEMELLLPADTGLSSTGVLRGSDNTPLLEFFEGALEVPNEHWYGSGDRGPKALVIGWNYDSKDTNAHPFDQTLGLQPGESLKGFGFKSRNLPGIHAAGIYGNAGYHKFQPRTEYEESEINLKMDEIEMNDFVPYNVAAPLIAVPAPFDPATVLENLRAHVATWPDKQLADAAFVNELDRNLQAAANAYRTGQSQEAREYIEILFGAIRRDHKDLDREDEGEDHDGKDEDHSGHSKKHHPKLSIDRLAARVLDFDLKYVLKRAKEESREHEDKGHDGRKDEKRDAKKNK